jgi:hypothetical protein
MSDFANPDLVRVFQESGWFEKPFTRGNWTVTAQPTALGAPMAEQREDELVEATANVLPAH